MKGTEKELLVTTCRKRTASTKTDDKAGRYRTTISTPLGSTRRASMLPTSSTMFRRLQRTGPRVNFPASILEKSKMSLMIERRHSPDVRIVSRHSCCSGVGSVSRRTEAMPMTPFSGVRISWLITWVVIVMNQ